MLKISNSLRKQKEIFKPHSPSLVQLYVCGMTVYDYCHIGHGRLFVAFDMMVRYLRYCGFTVRYVRNITDIDDKIIRRAAENGESIAQLTERFISALHQDEKALLNQAPDSEPRATQSMPAIVQFIERLIAKDAAYVAADGDVYFKVASFAHYGELAHQDVEKLRAGVRIDVLDAKHDPLDFVLWKKAAEDEPGWDSPWGRGRPGWHIECSAMSAEQLQLPIDIHGGGVDLIFPHHQNELAQSESLCEGAFVNYWLHVGHVRVNEEKMSKSLGNFFTIREVLKDYSGEVIRYFLLASHYKSPINYSKANLDSAKEALQRIYLSFQGLKLPTVSSVASNPYVTAFKQAMDDDFNTPLAFSVLFDGVREINRLKAQQLWQQAAQLAAVIKQLGEVLGLLQNDAEAFLRSGVAEDDAAIERLVVARKLARQNKDYQEADRLRDVLAAKGIIIEDGKNGSSWRRQF